jgi:hypothetical protein
MTKPATVGLISVFITEIGNGIVDFKITDIYGKYLTSGKSNGYVFDEKYNIFTASKVRVNNVAELVFNF